MNPKAVPGQTLPLKIKKADTLLDIENMITDLSVSDLKSVDLWLAKDLGIQLFKDTRVTALIAAAATRGIHTRVIDWLANPEDDHLAERFGTTIEGLGSLHYAEEIVDAQKLHLEDRIRHFRFDVIEKNGIKTPDKTYGSALTFCAFDPDLPTPVGFAGLSGKADFTRRFSNYRRRYFEVGVGEGFSGHISKSTDRAISDFAYELWQNAVQHGRFNKNNTELKGMRYLRVQKHIGYNKALFVRRAAGFAELRTYLDHTLPESGTFKLYEITISDNGMGIVERFLATRPEYASSVSTRADASSLLNKIIDSSLSSKRSQSGAGHGLEHAIEAVHNLKGFVSIRSGALWVYYTSADCSTDESQLLHNVRYQSKLARVGTTFNLIFPLISHRAL